MSFQDASDMDPSGILSATTAAVRLVGTVLKVAPGVKNAMNARSGGGGIRAVDTTGAGPVDVLNRVDPEQERRAYETVNMVLRTLGKRIGDAGLVSAPALAKALTDATAHIEVRLFSVEANRLFESLGSKLNDAVLVNSVFTSIYLIGALTAELSSSLPNYKPTYVPLAPRFIQQLFRTAIGEDAFRENLTANLDAFKTLATTAGLLRPTDIGYSIFPGIVSSLPPTILITHRFLQISHPSPLAGIPARLSATYEVTKTPMRSWSSTSSSMDFLSLCLAVVLGQ